MILTRGQEAGFGSLQRLGLAIRVFSDGGRHCGFLYRLDNCGVNICHLAFHYDLRNERPSVKYSWIEFKMDEYNTDAIVVAINQIASNAKNIPYGFDAAGSAFDPETGEFYPPPLGKGLTCATFVTAVLRSLGFDPIAEETWLERGEDVEWKARVVAALKKYGASCAHISGVEGDTSARRFRPEEVVSIAHFEFSLWPVTFADAAKTAEKILQELPPAD